MSNIWNRVRKFLNREETLTEPVEDVKKIPVQEEKTEPVRQEAPSTPPASMKRVCLQITAEITAEADKQPWEGSMLLRSAGNGPGLDYPGCYHGSTRVEWVSREVNEAGEPVKIHNPEESNRICPVTEGFTLLGRRYPDIRSIISIMDESRNWCRDVYGREVLYIRERFPCFDSYDYAYEHRYFHWFFLRQDGKLARIQYTDERDVLYITEDVAYVENKCWRKMEELKYFE